MQQPAHKEKPAKPATAQAKPVAQASNHGRRDLRSNARMAARPGRPHRDRQGGRSRSRGHRPAEAHGRRLPGAVPQRQGQAEPPVVTNLFGDMNVINKMFGWKDDVERTRAIAAAFRKPLKPEIISAEATRRCRSTWCSIPKDVNEFMVPIRHTTYESELTVGSGIRCISFDQFDGGTDLGYNRMNFRWGNIGTFQISPGSHMWQVANKYYKDDQPIPISMCFGVPPACTLLAGAGFDYVILPMGCDEIGIAGAVQGSPIRMVKCRTVDAYTLADAEIVLEGYIHPRDRRYETKESEDAGVQGRFHFHPGMGGLHGQGLQGADLPRHRRDHAPARAEADHLRARRPHARRPQHRHHRARGRDLRIVRAPAARHRAGRGDPLLHDRLGRLHHPGEEAPPDRRGLAAQLHGRGCCRARRACGSPSRCPRTSIPIPWTT